MSKKWMQKAVKNPGFLHRATGTPEGEKIPEKKVVAASHSENVHVRRAANLAKIFARFKHK